VVAAAPLGRELLRRTGAFVGGCRRCSWPGLRRRTLAVTLPGVALQQQVGIELTHGADVIALPAFAEQLDDARYAHRRDAFMADVSLRLHDLAAGGGRSGEGATEGGVAPGLLPYRVDEFETVAIG